MLRQCLIPDDCRAIPRSAPAFIGHVPTPENRGPGGALLLCVANTPIPCKSEFQGEQRYIQFTILNVRDRGWMKAPWYACILLASVDSPDALSAHALSYDRKKPAGKAGKVAYDENAKYLTEIDEWARNDVTMDRVGKSVLLYSFLKDGQNRGERVDDKITRLEAGQTIKAMLHHFMFENKTSGKGVEGARNVFPSDIDVIPAYSVVEIAINPANTKGYEEGWGISVARIRPCPFSLYSMFSPVGLELLPTTYEASVLQAESGVKLSPSLQRVLDTKNTAFFSKVTLGSYLIKHGAEDGYRLVGPKADSSDPMSRHLDVMEGGIFAVDISKGDLLRFTNGMEEEEEDSLIYAQCLVDLAASAGALSCYVVHNEYLLRKDPNRSPYAGVPLIDSNKLLECVGTLSPTATTTFPLPFPMGNMDAPYFSVDLACVDNNSAGDEDTAALHCPDFVFSSGSAAGVRYAYPIKLGDAVDDDIMRLLFAPKSVVFAGVGSTKRATLERTDYRLLKKQRVAGARSDE